MGLKARNAISSHVLLLRAAGSEEKAIALNSVVLSAFRSAKVSTDPFKFQRRCQSNRRSESSSNRILPTSVVRPGLIEIGSGPSAKVHVVPLPLASVVAATVPISYWQPTGTCETLNLHTPTAVAPNVAASVSRPTVLQNRVAPMMRSTLAQSEMTSLTHLGLVTNPHRDVSD